MRVALIPLCLLLLSGCVSQGTVLLTLDKEEYYIDNPVQIIIVNKTDEAIFFGGCNDYVIQKKVGEDWQRVGQKICVWEGIPQKLPPRGNMSFAIAIDEEGFYRIRFDYGVGCEEGKPMSQAGCASTHTIYKEFRVRAEWVTQSP